MHVIGAVSYLFGILINAAVAYWVYQDANGRGDSGAIGWAIGTFFCCPIVPIIYLVMRGRRGSSRI